MTPPRVIAGTERCCEEREERHSSLSFPLPVTRERLWTRKDQTLTGSHGKQWQADSSQHTAFRTPARGTRRALSVRDGERRIWTGPIPPPERAGGRVVRGVYRHAERQAPVLGQLVGERPDHPEDLLLTQPDEGGVSPGGLCRLPGAQRAGLRGRRGLLHSLFLPVKEAVDERRGGPAESGTVLSGCAGPGPDRQPEGGGDVGSVHQRSFRAAGAPERRWVRERTLFPWHLLVVGVWFQIWTWVHVDVLCRKHSCVHECFSDKF